MPVFVVERYLPRLTQDGVRAQALSEVGVEELGVRHVGTTYLCGDELCFSLFEAPSRQALCEGNERASMCYERIVEDIDFDRRHHQGGAE